jgi:uncharacterized protein (TIGR02466 family)
MNVSVHHQDLFPTRIWSFDLAELAPHFAQWREAVDRMRAVQPGPAGRSNRQGWNSDKTVFQQPEFGTLAASVQLAFAYALRQVTQGGDIPLQLEAWVNLHERGGYNAAHLHQGALLCGSFYLTVPEGSGDLLFRDPRPGVALSPFRGDGVNSSRVVNVRPYAGLLVVFPNWLEHEVALHEADAPRVAIAVNAMLPGQGTLQTS